MSRIAGLACMTVVLLLGCGGGDQPAEPETGAPAGSATAPAPMEDEGEMEAPAKPMASKPTTLPDDFPSDVPIGDSVPVSVKKGARGFSVSLESERAPADLVSDYRRNLEGEGWTIENEASMGSETMLMASKDGRGIALVVKDADGSSVVEIATVDAPTAP